jgi:hypothetical protein
MINPRSSLITLLAFILFYVQSSAVLHAVVHPFHTDDKYDNHEEHTAAHSFQRNQLHHSHKHQQHTEYDENIACDAFFAGERLTKYATLSTPPTIPTASFARVHYCALSLLVITHHKARPRARSPPSVFS